MQLQAECSYPKATALCPNIILQGRSYTVRLDRHNYWSFHMRLVLNWCRNCRGNPLPCLVKDVAFSGSIQSIIRSVHE